ncbi:unnamed protein product [Oreochromis niloticus]|nr:unnamed protein product [Mustela putorius furo]
MKLLTASSLLCAMMAPTAADEWYIVRKSASCPYGWTEYNDQCFFYVSAPVASGDAQRNCQSMSANLASVHSLEEYQLIQKVISDGSKASGRTWIGGSDGQQGYRLRPPGRAVHHSQKARPNEPGADQLDRGPDAGMREGMHRVKNTTTP